MESLRKDGIDCLGVVKVGQKFPALLLMQDPTDFGLLEALV